MGALFGETTFAEQRYPIEPEMTPIPTGSHRSLRNSMSDTSFPWHIHQPRPPSFAKWALECRWLAAVSPPEFRQTYLKLARGYEKLAEEREETSGTT